MRCILNGALLSSLACAVVAAPAATPAKPGKGKSFIVKRFENPNYVRVGAAAVRQAYGKFGWDLPHAFQGVGAASPNDTVGDDVRVAAAGGFIPGETQFLVPVTVGGQALHMNLDTGSSDL